MQQTTTAPAAPTPRAQGGTERLIVVALSGVALVLGLIGLGRAEFFPDESYTWSAVNRSFGGMVRILWHSEAYQVLHALLLWPVDHISDSTFALRLPSLVCFVATVPAVWALGRRLFDSRVGLVAALLLSVNAFALQYAQQARSYALTMMLATYAGAALTRDVTAPTRWSRPVWIACMVATVWAHGLALFVVVAQLGSLFALSREELRGRGYLRATVITGMLVLPVVIAPELQINRTEAYGAATHPNLTTFRLLVWSMAGRSVVALLPYAIAGTVALLAAWRCARANGRSLDTWRFALPLVWLVFPSAFLIAYSFVDPIWVERYAVPSLGALVVLVAYGLTRIVDRRLFVAALAITVATAAYGVARWYDDTGDAAFDKVVAAMHTRDRPADAVVLVTDRSRVPLEFALRHDRLRDTLVPVYPSIPWGQFHTGMQTGKILPESAVATLRASHPRVWVLSGFYDSDAESATALGRIERAGYRRTFFRLFSGSIRLSLYERS